MKENKIDSLPKWAQDRIALLENNLEYARARAEVVEGGTPSDTIAIIDLTCNRRTNLPIGCEVEFYPVIGPRLNPHISARLVKGALKIRGSDAIEIRPEFSNGADILLVGD